MNKITTFVLAIAIVGCLASTTVALDGNAGFKAKLAHFGHAVHQTPHASPINHVASTHQNLNKIIATPSHPAAINFAQDVATTHRNLRHIILSHTRSTPFRSSSAGALKVRRPSSRIRPV
jgi:hypothetical protein